MYGERRIQGRRMQLYVACRFDRIGCVMGWRDGDELVDLCNHGDNTALVAAVMSWGQCTSRKLCQSVYHSRNCVEVNPQPWCRRRVTTRECMQCVRTSWRNTAPMATRWHFIVFVLRPFKGNVKFTCDMCRIWYTQPCSPLVPWTANEAYLVICKEISPT